MSVEPETKFQLRLHHLKFLLLLYHLKNFWFRLEPRKIFRVWLHSPVAYTRLIHIRPSCWTTYRAFEIILEMRSVHWIKLQIQCYIQIQKHLVRYELCFKKHLIS